MANEEDVAIKEKERENKGESVVKVDSDVDVRDNGWKDGEMMYLFGSDYGYKKEEDVRDQHINELSAGSLSVDDNMDCDIFKKDDMFNGFDCPGKLTHGVAVDPIHVVGGGQ